jgi:tocopherol O-methyltransferase
VIASRVKIRGADIAQHYDALDSFYREIWGEHVHHGLWRSGAESLDEAVDQLTEFIAEEAALAPGDRVCDIGCGYGSTAQWLVTKCGVDVTAITISPAQHAVAVERNAGRTNPRFLVGDWLNNDLPAASFDTAVAIESSEHMPDKAAFFTQAQRVLRGGGRLVVSGWLTREAPSPREQRWLLEPICRESHMPTLGTKREYLRFAEEAGFQLVRFQDLTRQITRTWPRMVRTFVFHLLRCPASLRILLTAKGDNRVFALTIARLCLAFRTGALRYGVFTLTKAGA